ncbi:unnamed protein product [Xylocopa violacea]|uniref:Nose resistant-to-fluoxetine protein N-terminal domain-containing protein n=1 Tax=Xylocopa violacea TaxID=135666 RepID=A0ABP1NYC3_XYLVO
MTETVPAYALTGFVEYLNFSKCRTEMEEFRQGVDRRTLWALRMLDASGQPSYGFITGNNYWFGSRFDCKYLSDKLELKYSEDHKRNNSLYRNTKEEYPPFKLNFFTGNMRHNSVLQYHMELGEEEVVILGLCLPATCTENEVATMINEMLKNKTLFADEFYSMNLKLINVSDLQDDHQWLFSGQNIVMVIILVLLLAAVIVGTLYDVIVCQRRPQEAKSPPVDRKENINGLEDRVQVQNESDDGKSERPKKKPDNCIEQYLVCFSLRTNILKICTMNRSSKNVNVLDGMKVLSVLWVNLVHNGYFHIQFSGNRAFIYQESRLAILQLLFNGTYVVDTFFCISGFLLMHQFLSTKADEMKALSLTDKFKMFFSAFVNRYFRMAPSEYVLIFLTIIVFSWEKQVSVFNEHEIISDTCSKYWWRNFLFINNLYDWDEMCLIWTWYVPNDLQFFIFALFLLMLFITHRNIALAIGGISIVGSIVANGCITYSLNYTPTFDQSHVLLTYLYIQPWLRISPYLTGMGTYLLLEKWNYKLNLSKITVIAIWCIVFSMHSMIIFSVAKDSITLDYSIFYVALGRVCWGLGIGWIIIACTTNNAGFIEKLLSWKVWYPISKLSYTAYLTNPFVLIVMSQLSSYPTYTDYSEFVMYFGTTALTYIAALILSITVEIPFIRLLRVFTTTKTVT